MAGRELTTENPIAFLAQLVDGSGDLLMFGPAMCKVASLAYKAK